MEPGIPVLPEGGETSSMGSDDPSAEVGEPFTAQQPDMYKTL